MAAVATSGHFVGDPGKRIFLLARRPAQSRACVLMVPPFTEEANKTRRMLAVTATRLARAGISSLMLDLAGTGDSDDDFRNVDWETWKKNVSTAHAWAEANGLPITGVLAVRLGAALANAACEADRGIRVEHTVFWNPVFDGKRHLTQFLRLKAAAGLSDGNAPSTNVRLRLAEAGELEVAGYLISDALARQLEQVSPNTAISPALGTLTWLEVVRDAESPLPAQSTAMIQRHVAAGGHVTESAIAGHPFYSAVEITEIDELIDRSVRAFVDAPGD